MRKVLIIVTDSDFIFVRPDLSVCVLGLGLKAALGQDLFESVVSASVSPLHARKEVDRLLVRCTQLEHRAPGGPMGGCLCGWPDRLLVADR